jgi:hypothetical protein
MADVQVLYREDRSSFEAPPAEPAGRGSETPAGLTGHPARLRIERMVVVASAVLAVAVPTATALGLNFPGRALLALAFLLAVPGVPLVSLLRLPDALLASSLAGAVSIAATLLTATAAVVSGAWNPLAWSVGLALVDLVLTAVALRRLPASTGIAARQLPAPASGGRWSRRARERAVWLAVLLTALALWWSAASRADLDATGATGVVGHVGWPYVLAVVLVAAVAATQLLRPRPDGAVLTVAALVLALVIFGFVNVADGAASVPTGWHHVGFARYISVHETSFYGLDARASWPGFFAAAAGLVQLAGVPDASTFLQLAPFFYNAAAIAPLLVIARCVTGSPRLAWLSVFIYLGANWFQQDYFAPQATAFLLYLAILATLMWAGQGGPAMNAAPARRRHAVPVQSAMRERLAPLVRVLAVTRRVPGLPAGLTPRRSVALEATLLGIAAAIVVSHQLTPVTLVLTLLICAVTGYTRYRRLWLLVSLLFLGWFSYAATDFWAGHLKSVLADFGRVGANLDSAVTERVVGDPTYQLMQNMRLGWALVYVMLAMVGLWHVRRRPHALVVALLAGSTGSLVAMQSYGGEVVLRVFVFAAPLLAPLAALALRRFTRRGAVAGVALTGLIAGYAMVGTATRGVNVSFERVTRDDVIAARVLWKDMREGDTVGYVYPTGAYNADRVDDWAPEPLDETECEVPALQCAQEKTPRFILVSRSQDAAEQLIHGDQPGESTTLAGELVRIGLYRYLYRGQDAAVLILAEQTPTPIPPR